jgi:hypothetical protein
MRRTILAFLIFFTFTAMVLAADGDPKRAIVGVWTMGFCKAQSPAPYPYEFDCTTQVVNFQEDGNLWSSYMYDQNKNSPFGGLSVGAAGRWYYLGNHQFFFTMIRFLNDPNTGRVTYLLRTDFTMGAYPQVDEAVTGKMSLLYYAVRTTPPYVVEKNPYLDDPDETVDWSYLPFGIPMKRLPSYIPDSPVFQ